MLILYLLEVDSVVEELLEQVKELQSKIEELSKSCERLQPGSDTHLLHFPWRKQVCNHDLFFRKPTLVLVLPGQGSQQRGHRDLLRLPGHHRLHGRQVGHLHRQEGRRLQASPNYF